jgi:hypothetical protein
MRFSLIAIDAEKEQRPGANLVFALLDDIGGASEIQGRRSSSFENGLSV